MKKYILGLMLLLFGGCSKASEKNLGHKKETKIEVLSTTAMVEELVAQIGKEHVDSKVLIKGELDPHSYELVKGDYQKIEKAQVIFFNGLDLEHGASLKYLLEHSSKSVSLGNELIKKRKGDLIFIDGHVDPHVWMDLSLFSELIDPIVTKLSQLDPAHEKEYQINGVALLNKMKTMDDQILSLLHEIPKENRYLIASHDAFFYFTRRYLAETDEKSEFNLWRKRFAALEGLAPDGQISTQDIQKIIDHAIKFNVKVVFPESNLNPDGVKKVVHVLNKKGVETLLAKEYLYGDAIGEKNSGADSYLKMMQHNAKVIHKYLMSNK